MKKMEAVRVYGMLAVRIDITSKPAVKVTDILKVMIYDYKSEI
jgi:hypothetical protein